MKHRKLNTTAVALIALFIFGAVEFGKINVNAESDKPSKPDASAVDKDSDKPKIIINIVHSISQGKN